MDRYTEYYNVRGMSREELQRQRLYRLDTDELGGKYYSKHELLVFFPDNCSNAEYKVTVQDSHIVVVRYTYQHFISIYSDYTTQKIEICDPLCFDKTLDIITCGAHKNVGNCRP